MRQSKILKIMCYILLPVLIGILILSIFSTVAKGNVYYSEDNYFSSEEFVEEYMMRLDSETYELIYNNTDYNSIYDGEMRICYHYVPVSIYNFPKTKETYFLIIYKNLALTNVELRNTTNTIQGIKEYITSNENAKKVNILNGEIQSESEIIQRLGIQYIDNFKDVYYTRIDGGIEYITTDVKDFQIYSYYIEEFEENSEAAVISDLLEKVSTFERYSYFAIPISSSLIILILVYLVISIGYKKGKNGIDLNDFDKVPLEIILFIAIILGGIPFIVLDGINENYYAIISLIITAYLLVYILSAIIFDTIVKRIKSKTLLNSSIIGKIILLIAKCLEKMFVKYKEAYNTVTYSTSIGLKAFVYFAIVIPTGIAILIGFQFSFTTFVLELILAVIVVYRIIKTTKGYAQIENKLKEMYEGNNKNSLNRKDFGKEFHSTVKYINDISNGFENAIQDRMKSERMKAELITNVSHDIKTPLTSIINYVDLLKQENIENEKVKEYIAILDNKSQRLKKLTEDLVEASKVSTGNISLKIEKINIIQLIKQALGEFEDRFNRHGLEIIVESKEAEININADSRYMYRIIENLFSNISKYALENSRVYIDIEKTQKNVIIEMKNISKERLNISAEELIQRFVRGDKSRTTEGSGLGISIAQNLTELQGGQFRLKLDGDLFKVELEWEV